MLTAITSKGCWDGTPPSPTLPLVVPPSGCPLLRICVSVLDTLIHSHQHAGAHQPSVLGKLAFKLRYFREVNHPGEASTVCSLFLVEGTLGAVEFAGKSPLSLAPSPQAAQRH